MDAKNDGDEGHPQQSQETGPYSSSVSAKNCVVCFSLYDGNERRPRMLPCGHTFCSQCISKNYDGLEVSCPNCRRIHRASSLSDFVVNFDLENILQEYTSGTSVMANSAMTQLTTEPQTISKRLRSLKIELVSGVEDLTATSKEVNSQLEQYRAELENWKSEHKNFVSQIEDMVKCIDKELKRVKDACDEETKKREKTEMASSKLQSASSGYEILQSVENVNLCSEDLESLVQKANENFPNTMLISQSKELRGRYKPGPMKQFIAQDVDGIQNPSLSAKAELHQDSTSSPVRDESSKMTPQSREESRSCCLYPTIQKRTQAVIEGIPPWQRDQTVQTELRDTAYDVHKQPTSAIEARDLFDATPFNQRLLNATSVLVVKEGEGAQKKWYANIRVDDRQRVLLSALQSHEGLVPHRSSVLLRHDEVMTFVGTKSRRVFLEFGVGGLSLGTLIILLIDEGNYTSNFLHLCVGDKGLSYVGSKIQRGDSIGFYNICLSTGDYDVEGGQAVVSGVDWEEEYQKVIYKGPIFLKGRVGACSNSRALASQFSIQTKSSSMFPPPTFGKVEEGLDTFIKSIQIYSDFAQVEVIDCGIVLQQ